MACKLTYKGQRFNTELDLFNFIQMEDTSRQLQQSEIFTQMEEGLIHSYQDILDSEIEVPKLYLDENSIKNKIDSCSI